MTYSIAQLLNEGMAVLSHLPTPRREAELILAHLLQVNRSHLIAFPEREIAIDIATQYQIWLQKRANGYPYAYLTGEKEFFGLTLTVNQETLIPRDDTEIITLKALSLAESIVAPSILDLGTGSGAIALAIKANCHNCHVVALDQSAAALAIAKENASKYQLPITFYQSDWFSALTDERFDLILANPPYIDPKDHHLKGDGIKYEPISALVAAQNGYADLYTIIEEAPKFLKPQGYLLLEHGYNQAMRVQKKLHDSHYHAIETLLDYGGNPRVTIGKIH